MDDPGVILLVEDNPNDTGLTPAAVGENRPIPKILLDNAGKGALDYLYPRRTHRSRPAANLRTVLLGVKLPKVDGLEMLEHIKTEPNLKTIPVVMLTSSREERGVPRSYAPGTDAYLVKPISYKEFIEAIREIGLFWVALNQFPSTKGHGRWT